MKARRWIVEVCHSWFNRFRKLLVRYEKLERSFLALNQAVGERRNRGWHGSLAVQAAQIAQKCAAGRAERESLLPPGYEDSAVVEEKLSLYFPVLRL